MQLTQCFLLRHRWRLIVSIAAEFGYTTQRRAVPCEIASAAPVINMATMRNAARKRHVRPTIPKKESSPLDIVILRKRENKMLTEWRQNVKWETWDLVKLWWREYTFWLEVLASKVRTFFVSLTVKCVVFKFFVDSGASENIVSSNSVTVFGVDRSAALWYKGLRLQFVCPASLARQVLSPHRIKV